METTIDYDVDFQIRKVQDTFFNVVKRLNDDKKTYSIYNADTGDLITRKVSERYALIPNKDVIQPLIDYFGAENVSVNVTKKHIYVYTINTGRKFEIAPNDFVTEKIVIGKSYNKGMRFVVMFGAFRDVCANGLFSGEAFINYRKCHVGKIPVAELVDQIISGYQENNFEKWRAFAQISLTLDQELELIDTFAALSGDSAETRLHNNVIKGVAKLKVKDVESIDNSRNAWGLFNALNWAINVRLLDMQNKINANIKAEHLVSRLISM